MKTNLTQALNRVCDLIGNGAAILIGYCEIDQRFSQKENPELVEAYAKIKEGLEIVRKVHQRESDKQKQKETA